MLKKSIGDSVVVDPSESSGIQDSLSYEEIPVEVFDFQVRRVQVLSRSRDNDIRVPHLRSFSGESPRFEDQVASFGAVVLESLLSIESVGGGQTGKTARWGIFGANRCAMVLGVGPGSRHAVGRKSARACQEVMEILGIRFHPRDEELIRYLLKFVSCKNYSCDNIRFEDLYGNQKPWEIFESNSSGDDEDAKKVKYFFTQLHAQLKKKKSDDSKGVKARCLIQYEDVVLCYVKRKINVHACDHKELGDYMPMEIPSGDEAVAAIDGTLLTTQQHDSCLLNPFTSSEHKNVFHELQQDQNSEQLINQMQTIDEMVFSAQNHNDDVTSYSVEGATNFEDYDVDCHAGADF
ncbi:hypothetical protein FXO37_00052 [Capsicum annuum]|nr:hypothetical protein FXO37_00052 [Capsicum annuum]